MRYWSLTLFIVLTIVLLIGGQSSAFTISTEPLVGEAGFSGASDGNGNFLVGIERVTEDQNGPITAVLFDSTGTILKRIDTERIGCCSAGVAFDGTNYLLIWEDSNEHSVPDYSYQQVYGLFIDTGGNPAGAPFAISSTGIGLDGINAVAFNGTNYLVVYTKLIDPSKGENWDNRYIAGAMVSTDGTVSGEFRISEGYGHQPTVDSDGTNFFVVWVEDSADKEIMGRIVNSDGTLGAEIEIDSSSLCSDNPPAVKYGLNSYLVAFSDQRGTGSIPCSQAGTGGWDIVGQMVGTDGTLINNRFYIKQGGSQIVPTIAFDGEKFLVAYNDYTSDTSNYGVCDSTEGTCWDIRARYVSAEGAVIGNPITISAGAGIEVGGIGGYDSTSGFLALINKCGNRIFGPKCDVYGKFITPVESYVAITYPRPNEAVPSGSTYPIQWTASPDLVKFTIRLSTDNGYTWTTIAPNVEGTTSFNWPVPTPLNNKTKCLLKITGYDANGNALVVDKSDAPFTIEVIKLNTPNGGETLTSGSTYNITWTTNQTIRPVSKVILSYTLDGGVTWKAIPAITGNPGTYSWTVPTVSTSKTKCKVKVVLKDSAGNTIGSDVSDDFFTINP
jgi:hypothetical protein